MAGGLTAAGAGGITVAQAQGFFHPGLLLQADEFDRMRNAVQTNREPQISGWNRLITNSHSSASWEPRAVETIVRGDNGTDPENYWLLYNDMHAAYQNGLRWKATGDTAHRDCAVRILNAWSGTLKVITGWTEASLAAGIYGYQAANAAEIVRDAPGFDRARFQTMLAEVFYPMNNDFLVRRHGTCDGHYWANWDLCNMASILAIGIFNEDRAKFDEAIEYFWNGKGQGSIEHVIPFIHGDLGQWQESGRDQSHSMMGIGLMAEFMEMAWNQGVDLYSARDSAFAKAAEYVARYNNGHEVPFTKYVWHNGHNCSYNEHTQISSFGRGGARPVWELVYAHYNGRMGRAMPNVWEMIIGKVRAEGGGGHYGPNSGGFDSLGLGTFCYARDNVAPRVPLSGATYRIRNASAGLYLDSGPDGAVALESGSSYDDQRWMFTEQQTGYWTIDNVATGREYLDTDPGGQVIWNTGWIGDDTLWAIQRVTGGFRVENKASGRGYLYGSGTSVGWNSGATDDNTVWVLERQ